MNTINRCPYCQRDTSGTVGMLVVFDGRTYRECGMNEGHNAEGQASWSSYLGGALIYDIPFLLFGIVVITVFHLVLSESIDAAFAASGLGGAWIPKAVVYGVVTLFPVAITSVSGLPIFISPFALAMFSYWMLFGV